MESTRHEDHSHDHAGMSVFARTILENKNYAHLKPSGHREDWGEVATRLVHNVVQPYLPALAPRLEELIKSRKFMPGGRYLYAAGRRYPQVNNCFLFRAHDSREGWGKVVNDCCQALMTGGGIGVVYSDLRERGAPVGGLGGQSTGPLALMNMVNEMSRHVRQGGSRRSAVWAGLRWDHPDVFEFIGVKEWPGWLRQRKLEDFNTPAPMDGTNISVILDDGFFAAYGDKTDARHDLASNVFWTAVRGMLKAGEPGFSVDIGSNAGENLRNACCEVTSRDDGDMCNLGSLNLARLGSAAEFGEAVELATAFLLCGTLYSQLPLPGMYATREKNRRLGLGLMGVHEWLLKRGRRYAPDPELGQWLAAYTRASEYANHYADILSISRPVATRSVAPTGTISIVAETTSGLEPVYAAAYKRRYRDGEQWKAQYVLDATARRLVDAGVDPDLIEDSYTLAEDVERRVAFQAWVQGYVDHGISSTINLPPWGSSLNNENTVTQFGRRLLQYLPQLRGITAYPDGSRGGQPLNRVNYHEAVHYVGREFLEETEYGNEQSCKGGVCGE